LNNLSVVYRNMKRMEEAEQSALAALTVQEEVLGKDHPNLSYALNNLYRCQFTTNPYRAKSTAAKACSIPERVYGIHHRMACSGYRLLTQITTLDVTKQAADDHRLDVNLIVIEDLCQRCITVYGGPKSVDAGAALVDLIDIYLNDRYWNCKTPLSDIHHTVSLPPPPSDTPAPKTKKGARTDDKEEEEYFDYPYSPSPNFVPLNSKPLTKPQQEQTVEVLCMDRIQACEERKEHAKLPDFYSRLGKLYFRQQKWAEAQKYFELAFKHDVAGDDNDPNLFIAYIIKICQTQGNTKGAEEWKAKYPSPAIAEQFALTVF